MPNTPKKPRKRSRPAEYVTCVTNLTSLPYMWDYYLDEGGHLFRHYPFPKKVLRKLRWSRFHGEARTRVSVRGVTATLLYDFAKLLATFGKKYHWDGQFIKDGHVTLDPLSQSVLDSQKPIM